MDKNMMNIDNLVRSRLGGAEEAERPGAWSSMKELLDKEMPKQAAAFNWRRMLGYATALVVATSVSFGGYKMLSSDTPTRTIASAANSGNTPNDIKSLTKTTTVAGSEGTRPTNNANTLTEEKSAAIVAANTLDNQATNTNHSNSNRTHKHNIHTATSAAGVAPAANQELAMNESAAGTDNSETVNASSHQLMTSAGVASDATAPGKAVPTNTNGGDQPGPANPLFNNNTKKNNNGSKALKQTKQVALAKPERTSTKPANTNNHTSASTAMSSVMLPASASATQMGMPATKPALTNTSRRLRSDSIQQIEIRYTRVYNPLTQKMAIRKDTLSYQKMQVLREESGAELTASNQQKAIPENNTANKPSTRPENNTAKTIEEPAVPQAAMKTAKDVDNNNNLVSLSKYRVDSKFNNIWDANARRFSAFVQNVHIALDRARFYGGITGGFNTTVFSNNSLAGFQLGFNGLLTFNEHWSMAADLKYFHRFNSVSINDDYTKVTNIVAGNESVVNGVAYREYTWNEDKVDHSFNLTAVQTVELPVTLRYNMGRVFGEIGLNMMYSFTINAEEIERANNKPSTVTKTYPNTTSPIENTGSRPQISLSDFNSRFGLGYVLGAGYQVSPALSANFRIVQNVWDNIGTDGGRKVSRNLYQTPSVQVSLGYRFGRKH